MNALFHLKLFTYKGLIKSFK
ncbi:hypothetical protein SPHINGOT1_640006 [Sphingomonas sp. T1]|nr:hypothetical protein SPHINGOT1_640006 [Sphingomonas sp. T1]